MVYSIPKRAGRSAAKPSRKTSASADKPDKGEKGGSCNRSCCQAPGAVWIILWCFAEHPERTKQHPK